MPTTYCEACGSSDVQWSNSPACHLLCHTCGHEERYAGVPEHLRPPDWQKANPPRRGDGRRVVSPP